MWNNKAFTKNNKLHGDFSVLNKTSTGYFVKVTEKICPVEELYGLNKVVLS